MLRWFAVGVVVAAGLAALTLTMPVQSWRTGRLDAPPLEVVAGGPEVALSRRVWVDTDAACGASPMTDPDDCLAIAWLAGRGDLDIAGISTSFGNADAAVVLSTARSLIDAIAAAGLPVPEVWRGSANPLRFSDTRAAPAHDALLSALAQGPLTILALGPLTNIAAALADRPDLRGRVVRLVAVMGHRPGHLFHPSEGSGRGTLLGHGPIFRDLNFAKDPEAARSVLAMRLPVTLVPYDAARAIRITGADLDRLAQAGPALAWAARRSRGWLRYWHEDVGQAGFYPFDWVAAAYAVEPQLLDCADTTAWVETEWAFGLFPRPSLLVGPPPPAARQEAVPVVYCPAAGEGLQRRLAASQ